VPHSRNLIINRETVLWHYAKPLLGAVLLTNSNKMTKKNIISGILYLLIITVYAIVQEYPLLFMWLCWVVGYSKGIWDYIE
jgi:hypothetical protein